MSFVFVLISVGVTLFLWMYLLTYFMHIGAQKDFFLRARSAVLRWMGVAGSLLCIHLYLGDFLTQFQWILIPLLFFLWWLPFIWNRWKYLSLLPLAISIGVYGIFYWTLSHQAISEFLIHTVQTPLYEEVGKWFHSLVYAYPAVMSPFVAIGFWFLENIAYFSTEFSWSQFLGRTLFSLPMHLFAGFLGFWCLCSIRPIWLGMILGCLVAISVHTLYNWSLDVSVLITLVIMIGGYVFYGWSLENGWWKKWWKGIDKG